MAAYAALVSLQHVLEQILDRDDQDFVILDGKHEMKSLHKDVVSLVTFLEDCAEDAGAVLEGRIRSAVNQAQDIIEGWVSDELHSDDGGSYEHKAYCNDWRKLVKELQGIMKELEIIAEEAMQIKNSSGTKDQIFGDFHGSSSSGLSRIGEGTTVGLEQDLLEIKERLCGANSKLETIPIIGMGGIGKTTLARLAYDDCVTIDRFDVRAWVTVSQDYDIQKVLSTILNCMVPSYKEQREERIREYLHKFLTGRRYLIVLDDMWDARVWDVLRQAFPDGSNGSRIIITSRDRNVASYIDPEIHPHKMNLMGPSQSWNLLKEKVFAQEDCPPKLERIGKFIAEKCGGLPLAVVVIAGILSKDKLRQETWKHIELNVNKAVNSGDGMLDGILSLSYKHLPQHLKPCFLYIGGFPEDYEIKVSKLVTFWIAEGFLKSNGLKYDLEKVAEEYVEELIKRNLILVMKKSNGNTKTIKIHDVLRDLCLKKARDEKFLKGVSNYISFETEVQNSYELKTFPPFLNEFLGCGDSYIHITLFSSPSGMVFESWNSCKRLKILDAVGVEFRCFPSEIGELFQLRYLAITLTMDKVMGQFQVPSYLSKLRKLQTLIILSHFGYPVLFSLPFGVWRLPQLRHLVLSDICCPDLCQGPLTTLENLCTLSRITSFTCSESILKVVPRIKGLKVFYPFDDVSKAGWSKYRLDNLVHFHFLEKLSLQVGEEPFGFHLEPEIYFARGQPFVPAQSQRYSVPTLCKSNIAFSKALKKLTLTRTRLLWEDMSIIGLLPKLEVLKLKDNACYGDYWKTALGEFLALKVLVIHESDPRDWITESSHLPYLQSLVLVGCRRLGKIPEEIGEIPSLQLIALKFCPSSIKESAKQIEEDQRSNENYDLQVRIL